MAHFSFFYLAERKFLSRTIFLVRCRNENKYLSSQKLLPRCIGHECVYLFAAWKICFNRNNKNFGITSWLQRLFYYYVSQETNSLVEYPSSMCENTRSRGPDSFRITNNHQARTLGQRTLLWLSPLTGQWAAIYRPIDVNYTVSRGLWQFLVQLIMLLVRSPMPRLRHYNRPLINERRPCVPGITLSTSSVSTH